MTENKICGNCKFYNKVLFSACEKMYCKIHISGFYDDIKEEDVINYVVGLEKKGTKVDKKKLRVGLFVVDHDFGCVNWEKKND